MITLGLIGVGRWGINFLKTAEKLNNVRIKYVAAKSSKNLAKLSNRYTKTTNYKDFFKFPDIDGVIIATPGSTHYRIIKEFAKCGYPLLVEKPLTINYQEALDIRKEFKDNRIMVGHIYLFNPAFIAFKNTIPQIGRIEYISFKLCNLGPEREDMSVVWDFAPHGISICMDLLEKQPEEITSWAVSILRPNTNLYDNAVINLRFKNNVSCLMELSRLYPVKKRELVIYGTKGTILFDDLAEKKVILLEGKGSRISFPAYSPQSALESELNEFTKLIKTGKPPITDLNHTLKIMSVLNSVEKSLKEINPKAKLLI
jgi:predicted dehydrogenase